MIVIKRDEAGYGPALEGLALSYNSEPSKKVADRLAFKGGGHSKFLESIDVWLRVTATRKWWAQADTYRIATKQSESTMHTILRKKFTRDMFTEDVSWIILLLLNFYRWRKDFKKVKANLPEDFLQTRVWKIPYNVLQNMEHQRRKHKLPEWQEFLDQVLAQVNNPEWIQKTGLRKSLEEIEIPPKMKFPRDIKAYKGIRVKIGKEKIKIPRGFKWPKKRPPTF